MMMMTFQVTKYRTEKRTRMIYLYILKTIFTEDLTPQTATKRMWVKIIHFRFDIPLLYFSRWLTQQAPKQSFFHSSCLSPLLFPLPSAHVAVPSLPEMKRKTNEYPINMNGKVQYFASAACYLADPNQTIHSFVTPLITPLSFFKIAKQQFCKAYESKFSTVKV